MDHWFILLVASLATWRAAELVAFDSGPFHVFKLWRDLWKKRPIVHELFTCPYCCAAYLAIACCYLIWLGGYTPPTIWFLYWFAVWGGAMAIMRAVRERD